MEAMPGWLSQRELQQRRNAPGAAALSPRCSSALYRRMALEQLLVGHRGCVNHIQFNESGSLLASGSDDTHICLWDLNNNTSKPLLDHHTGHTANIFCVRYMPTTDTGSQPLLASCAGDCEVRLHDVNTAAVVKVYTPHTGRVKKLVTEPYNPNLLISCSEDGSVRQLDLRSSRQGSQLLQLSRNGMRLEINSISAPWHKPWLLAVGASDDALRVYDRRMTAGGAGGAGAGGGSGGSRSSTRGAACKAVCHLSPAGQAPHFSSDCISGVAFADDGRQVLANYLGDYVYLWSLPGSRAAPNNTTTAAAAQQEAARARKGSSSSGGGGGGSGAAKRSRGELTAAGQEQQQQQQPHAAAAGGVADGSNSPLQPPSKLRSHRSDSAGEPADAAAEAAGMHTGDDAGNVAATAAAAADVAAVTLQQKQQQRQQQQDGPDTDCDMPDTAAAAGAAAGAESDGSEPPAAGGGDVSSGSPASQRVLSVDDAVQRLERGDIVIAQRRRGAVASAILNRSQDLYEAGEVDASLRYALVCLRLRPNYGMAHYQAAVCYERLGLLQQALSEAERALDMAWGYDLQQFVRRICRRLTVSDDGAAAADGGAPGGATAAEAAAALGRRRHRHRRHADADGQAAAPQPLQAAAAAAAADGADAAVSSPPSPAAAVDGEGFAAAVAAASGSSRSWSPDSQGAGDTNSSGSSGSRHCQHRRGGTGAEQQQQQQQQQQRQSQESGDVLPSDDVLTDMEEERDSLGQDGAAAGDSTSSSSGSSDESGESSSSDGSSSSSETSESSSSSDEEGEEGSDDGSAEGTGSSQQEDEGSSEGSSSDWLDDDDSAAMLGLDGHRSYYDWGGTDTPAAAAAYQEYQRQQQARSSSSRVASAPPNNNSSSSRLVDAERFDDLITPIRNQLMLLQVRREERLPRHFARRLRSCRQRLELLLSALRHQVELQRLGEQLARDLAAVAAGCSDVSRPNALQGQRRQLQEQYGQCYRDSQEQHQQARQQQQQQSVSAQDPLHVAQLMLQEKLLHSVLTLQQRLVEVALLLQQHGITVQQPLAHEREEEQQPQQQQQQQQPMIGPQPWELCQGLQQQPGHRQPDAAALNDLVWRLERYEQWLFVRGPESVQVSQQHAQQLDSLQKQWAQSRGTAAAASGATDAADAGRERALLRLQVRMAELLHEELQHSLGMLREDDSWVNLAHLIAGAKAGRQGQQQHQGQQQQERQQQPHHHQQEEADSPPAQQQECEQQQDPPQETQQRSPARQRSPGRWQQSVAGATTAAAAAHAALLPEFESVKGTMDELKQLHATLIAQAAQHAQHARDALERHKQHSKQRRRRQQDAAATATAGPGAGSEDLRTGSSSDSDSGATDAGGDAGAGAAAGGGRRSRSVSPVRGLRDGDGAGLSQLVFDADQEQQQPPLLPQDLLQEDDPVLLELGALLAAGDPLSEATAAYGEAGSASTGVGAGDVGRAAAVAEGGGSRNEQEQQQFQVPGSSHRQHQWACRYRGHVSLKTIKDVAFVGPQQSMVAAGSDDGRMFVWDRHTGALITALRGDRYVVNCIDSHPTLPLLACCGIDATIKLWSPCLTHPRAIQGQDLMFSLAYNEVERAAVGACNMFNGLNDMCTAFSRQQARAMVQRLRAEGGAAGGAGT